MIRLNFKKLTQTLTLFSFILCYSLFLAKWTNQYNLVDDLDHVQVQSLSESSLTSSLLESNQEDKYKTSFQERGPRSISTKYSLSNSEDGQSSLQQSIQQSNQVILTTNKKKKKLNKSKSKVPTRLKDIFISVKTTKSFHKTRLDLIIKTWFNLAKDQVFIAIFV